jgi:hypothetical protein
MLSKTFDKKPAVGSKNYQAYHVGLAAGDCLAPIGHLITLTHLALHQHLRESNLV